MTIQFQFVVHDAATSAPLSGARVFAFGPGSASGVTGAEGSVILDLEDSSSYTISVFKDSYETSSVSLVVDTSDPAFDPFIGLTLRSLSPARHRLKFVFSPAVPGILWSLVDSDNLEVESGASEPDGQAVTVNEIDEGTYTLGGILSGYGVFSETITVGPKTEFAVVLEKLHDDGASLDTSGASDSDEAIELSDASLATRLPDDEEQIYANDAFTRYFTATLARIYIGNLFVDEVHSVQFVLQQNRSPVYGYASRFADAYSTGRSLVQGQIIVNYVHPGYLRTILQEYHRLFLARNSVPDEASYILSARSDRRQLLSSGISESDPAVQRLDRRIQELLLSARPEDVARVRDQEQRQLAEFRDVADFGDQVVYQDIVFDLQAEVGQGVNKMVRRLEKCVLGTNDMVFAQDGQPLQESYSFVARRLR